jgi:type VI secretion system protein VasD
MSAELAGPAMKSSSTEISNSSALRWLFVLMVLALSACASGPPKPVKAHMSVAARADANPDASGRPSPIVIRIYQLKADSAFAAADFFALFDDDKKTLAADIAGEDEFELSPGEEKKLEFKVSGEARFVGAIAAFRDIRNSTWRVLQPAPKKGIKNIIKSDALTIVVEKSRITLTVAD